MEIVTSIALGAALLVFIVLVIWAAIDMSKNGLGACDCEDDDTSAAEDYLDPTNILNPASPLNPINPGSPTNPANWN